MPRDLRNLLAVAACLAAAGCGVSRPEWLNPGTAGQQQARAQRFDPYPENDVGPPVVGARPREFQAPTPETNRARRGAGGWSW